MAPTAVLIEITPKITTMNSNDPTTLTNNALSLSNGINGPTSFHIDVYQQTKIGSSEVSIRTLVPASISAEPYRKALIGKMLFRKILTLSATHLSPPVISWRLSRRTSGLSRDPLRGRQKPRSPLFARIFCFKSQIPLKALRTSPI